MDVITFPINLTSYDNGLYFYDRASKYHIQSYKRTAHCNVLQNSFENKVNPDSDEGT